MGSVFREALQAARIAYVSGSYVGQTIELEISGILKETGEAVLLSVGGEKVWIPKVCLHYAESKEAHLSERIAIDKGLI